MYQDQHEDQLGLKVQNTADEVSIDFQEYKQAADISCYVPFGPQDFKVAAQLELTRKGDVEVSAWLSGEGHFRWELWRNDFTCRLEEMRQFQEENGLEFAPVLRTVESITHGMDTAEVIAFGTGQQMMVTSSSKPVPL